MNIATGLATLAAIVVIPLSVQTWAEGMIEERVIQAEMKMEVQSTIDNASHDYDVYSLKEQLVEDELIELEQVSSPTPTQERRIRRLEGDLQKYSEQKDLAFEVLKRKEADHETEESPD